MTGVVASDEKHHGLAAKPHTFAFAGHPDDRLLSHHEVSAS
jgi:hypothetical protein